MIEDDELIAEAAKQLARQVDKEFMQPGVCIRPGCNEPQAKYQKWCSRHRAEYMRAYRKRPGDVRKALQTLAKALREASESQLGRLVAQVNKILSDGR